MGACKWGNVVTGHRRKGRYVAIDGRGAWVRGTRKEGWSPGRNVATGHHRKGWYVAIDGCGARARNRDGRRAGRLATKHCREGRCCNCRARKDLTSGRSGADHWSSAGILNTAMLLPLNSKQFDGQLTTGIIAPGSAIPGTNYI
jgi:hypothetical protein